MEIYSYWGNTFACSSIFLPNTPFFKAMPDWWTKNMPDKGITLGLDLQGGIHLVFEVEGEKAVEITTGKDCPIIKGYYFKKEIKCGNYKQGIAYNSYSLFDGNKKKP